MTGEQSAQAVKDEAAKLAATLYGRDGRFGTTTWNRPEELGKWLSTRLVLDGPLDEAAYTAALMLAREVLGLIEAVETEQVEDGDWEWQLDGMVENYTQIFLGIPET